MTPREMAAWLHAGRKLDHMRAAETLVNNYVAAQGDQKAINKQLKALQKEEP